MHKTGTGSEAPGAGVLARTSLQKNIPPGDPFANQSKNRLPLQGGPVLSPISSPEKSENIFNVSPLPSPFKKTPKDFEIETNVLSKKAAEILDVALNKTDDVLNSPFKLEKISYDEKFGPQMYAYFSGREKEKKITDTYIWKNGEVEEKYKMLPNTPPHFSEFARSIGVTARKLKAWAKTHIEFGEYYDACVDIIQEFYIDNGITGKYAGQFSIFAAKNTTKMKDVQESLHKTVNFKDVLDAIEKGKNLEDGNF